MKRRRCRARPSLQRRHLDGAWFVVAFCRRSRRTGERILELTRPLSWACGRPGLYSHQSNFSGCPMNGSGPLPPIRPAAAI